tara:strand:+ start:5182 stop:5391 length:210 start_codon:yes stop_codon:yes gene_type:complete
MVTEEQIQAYLAQYGANAAPSIAPDQINNLTPEELAVLEQSQMAGNIITEDWDEMAKALLSQYLQPKLA